jgi:hypothetical protein
MDAITRHTGLNWAGAARARLETTFVPVVAATVTATVILATARRVRAERPQDGGSGAREN